MLTFSALQLQSVSVDPAGAISDHALVICRLPVVDHSSTVAERIVRSWRTADRVEIRRLLKNSDLCCPVSADCDADQMFDTYESVLCNVADKLAPPHTVRRRSKRLAPWFDSECRALRRNCRRLERRYRRTRSPADRRQWSTPRADGSRRTVPRRMNTGLIGCSSVVVLRSVFGVRCRQSSAGIVTSPALRGIQLIGSPRFLLRRSTTFVSPQPI